MRGVLISGTGGVLGRLARGKVAAAWRLAEAESFALVLVGAAVSAGILLHDLGGLRKRRTLFAAGLALGAGLSVSVRNRYRGVGASH